jgi:formylmethanofuran dehydrogenase subunit E-like metal-binding protein
MRRKVSSVFWGLAVVLCVSTSALARAPDYDRAVYLGAEAVEASENLLATELSNTRIIALTNAGYSEAGGKSTLGCLDGIAAASTASVGSSTIITLQCRPDEPLWFAFYVPASGKCAYLQMDADKTTAVLKKDVRPDFELKQSARIDSAYIFNNPKKFKKQAKEGLFGKNLFRVVTVANAAAQDCPDDVLQAIRVHDHYCPGVTFGVLLARYVQNEIIEPDQDGLFVLSLVPWRKEDALTTLLNVTPGKRSYGVFYADKGKTGEWPEPLNKSCTIVFTKKGEQWTGHILGFDRNRAKKMCGNKKFGFYVLNQLYADLWFLDYMDRPEKFVDNLGTIVLKKGESPKNFLRPEISMLKKLTP